MDWNPPFVLRILMMGQDRFTRLLVHVNDLKMQLWSLEARLGVWLKSRRSIAVKCSVGV